MGGFEEDRGSQEHPVFLHDKDTFSRCKVTEDITFITVSYSFEREKTVPEPSPHGNCCREIPQKNSDTVEYPGRSVLYSGQFHPLNRIIRTNDKQPPVGEL